MLGEYKPFFSKSQNPDATKDRAGMHDCLKTGLQIDEKHHKQRDNVYHRLYIQQRTDVVNIR